LKKEIHNAAIDRAIQVARATDIECGGYSIKGDDVAEALEKEKI